MNRFKGVSVLKMTTSHHPPARSPKTVSSGEGSMGPQKSGLRSSQGAWLEELKVQGHSAKTLQAYRLTLGQLVSFLNGQGRHQVSEVSPADLEAWRVELAGRGLRPASLASYLQAARGWFHWLHRTGQVFLDPAADLHGPKIPRKMPAVPSVEEMTRLVESVAATGAIDLRDRAILETLYATGLRREECARLRTADVDLADATVRVLGKGAKERVVPLTRPAVECLRLYLKEARPALLGGRESPQTLWLNRHGRPLSGYSLAAVIRNRARAAGLASLTPHALRRACATHLLENGAHPAELQLLLGHASLKHLGQYLRLGIRELKAAHARSRLGA